MRPLGHGLEVQLLMWGLSSCHYSLAKSTKRGSNSANKFIADGSKCYEENKQDDEIKSVSHFCWTTNIGYIRGIQTSAFVSPLCLRAGAGILPQRRHTTEARMGLLSRSPEKLEGCYTCRGLRRLICRVTFKLKYKKGNQSGIVRNGELYKGNTKVSGSRKGLSVPVMKGCW
jgi:hypothetical protein